MSPLLARFGRFLLDVVPVVAIACVVFYLIRAHLIEYYQVPSQSMEPTIHGNERDGDLVLVDKTGFWFRRPKAHDLVVVRGLSDDANHMVKRCAAVAEKGNLELRIHDGDLYRKASGEPSFERVTKGPVAHRDMRVPVFRHPTGPCEQTLEEFFHLPPLSARVAADGVLHLGAAGPGGEALVQRLDLDARRRENGEMSPTIPGLIATHKAVDTSYLTPSGRREWQARSYYADIGIELGLRIPEGASALLFVLEYRDRDYALLWDREGVRLIVKGRVVTPTKGDNGATQPKSQPQPLRSGTAQVAFGYLDGRLFLALETPSDPAASELLFCEPVQLAANDGYRRPNRLHFGVAGGEVTVSRVVIFHDIPVTAIGGRGSTGSGTYAVEEGHMFLLGDNPHDSADSRGSLGTVPLERLVGRPAAILAPASRSRFFIR